MVVLMAGCFRWIKNRKQPPKDIKLVIIGLDDAGKTTTIACLLGEPPDGITPTVGFSNANITMGKSEITIYDLGGGAGVRSVWQKYYAEVYGIIFAVDSGDQSRLVESKNVLYEIFDDPKVCGKPVIVFANKQDKEGALNEEEVVKKLALEELSDKHNFKYNVFPCSAVQGYGKKIDKRIRSGLEWLLNTIHQDYSTLNEKVTKESAIQREQEQKERRERMERIRLIREEREKAAKEAGVEEEEDSDEDVITDPFRNIKDQVEVTAKREKKAKEKMKKIKEHQMKTNAELTESTGKTKKRSKKTKASRDDNDDYDEEDNAENNDEFTRDDNDSLPRRKSQRKKKKSVDNIQASDNEGLSPKSKKKNNKSHSFSMTSFDESTDYVEINDRKKKSKSQRTISDQFDEENREVTDLNASIKGKRKKRLPKSSIVDVENELSNDYNKINLNNNSIGNELPPRHNVIQVSSKENVRENPPPNPNKKKKKLYNNNNNKNDSSESDNNNNNDNDDDNVGKMIRKKKRLPDVNNYYVADSSSDVKGLGISEKEINDSRAELFRARSIESLDRREHEESNCCNNKRSKKKKGRKQSGEFHDVQETKTEGKKKKKKKGNRTDPQVGCSSYIQNVSNGGGSLPPLRGASKLEPIKVRGSLPKWNSAEESSVPSWALAKPNFDDDEVIT